MPAQPVRVRRVTASRSTMPTMRRSVAPQGGQGRAGTVKATAYRLLDPMAELRRFFRSNPQVLILLIICLVLGIGTFMAVVLGLIGAGSTTTDGMPSGVILALQALL